MGPDFPAAPAPDLLRDTINVGALPGADALVLPAALGSHVRAIGVESHSLTTRNRELEVEPDADLAHAAVVERHHATGRVGRGYATGFGLARGAIASTVAHDAHNIVVVGRSGEDMHTAVARLAEIGGGQVAVLDGTVLAEVPLPLAGLMSDLSAAEVSSQIEVLNRAFAGENRREQKPVPVCTVDADHASAVFNNNAWNIVRKCRSNAGPHLKHRSFSECRMQCVS